jgi:hypothetical protein
VSRTSSKARPLVGPAAPHLAGDELTGDLQRLRRRLAVVIDGALAAPGRHELGELSAYLVNDLNPVLNALALRVYPSARRLGVTGPATSTAAERARLLRLTERLAMIGAQQADPNEIPAVIEEIDALASDLLLRALSIVPILFDRLAKPDAARIVDAAQRTARAGRRRPHPELEPTLL